MITLNLIITINDSRCDYILNSTLWFKSLGSYKIDNIYNMHEKLYDKDKFNA